MATTLPTHTITFDDVTLICVADEVPEVLRVLDNHAAKKGDRPPLLLRHNEISKSMAPYPGTAYGLATLLRAEIATAPTLPIEKR